MTELQEIQITIEEAKEEIALKQSLENLEKNADFQKLILNQFFKEEVLEVVPLMASPNEAARKGAENVMVGVSALTSFFRKVYRKGEAAEASLEQHEQAKLEAME